MSRLAAHQEKEVLGVDVAWYRDGHLSSLQGNLLCGILGARKKAFDAEFIHSQGTHHWQPWFSCSLLS